MNISEIKTLIEEQGEAFEAFKAEHNAALDEQAVKLAALQLSGHPGKSTAGDRNDTPAFKAMREYMRGVRTELTGASNPDGGFAVPKEVDGTINDQLVALSPMRSVARIVKTTTRDYHTLIGKRGATSGWVGEEDNRTATDTPELVDIKPPSGEVYAYPSATNWVLDDAAFELEQWLFDNVATEIAIREGEAFVSGDGDDKPKGFLSYAGTTDHPLGEIRTVKSGAASALKLDGLIDLVYDLTAPYRAGAVFMMNSATAGAIRKIKDGNGNFIWQPGLQAGQPANILGYPVVVEEAMPDIGAGNIPIAFGNFRRGYLVTDRNGINVIRDNVTKPGWTKFYFAKRVGGDVTDVAALRLLEVGI